MEILKKADPEISQAIEKEIARQRNTVNLIASENYTSRASLEAQGSFLTNKYAEGYPGKRYYGGCEDVDIVEEIAIKRSLELFGAEHSNVQPHSGTQANMASYFAILKPGDTIMGMSLAHGGHLSHGAMVNFSGSLYNVIAYGVNRETERLDYHEIERLALEHHPKAIIAGASAYPRVIDFEKFRQIADLVGARLVVDMAHIAGIVAAGLHPTPVPYADVVTSTTHKTLRGPRGGFILCRQELARAIDSAVFPRVQGGPLMHVIAAKAVAFGEALKAEFTAYQKAVLDNALALAQELKSHGLRLVSGGTDNHLILVDLNGSGVNGKQAEEALGQAGIVVNRNAIPFDTNPPRTAGGIRLGTPAITSRGFDQKDARRLGELIVKVISNIDKPGVIQEVREETLEMCRHHPVPGADF